MDSFSKHEQSLSAVEEYAELDGCGRLFFQNADQGKDICSASSRFLDENFLDETTNDQSWRSWQRPMSDSSDFLEFGKHTMPDFSLNCPYRLKGGDAMNAGEMDNDANILGAFFLAEGLIAINFHFLVFLVHLSSCYILLLTYIVPCSYTS